MELNKLFFKNFPHCQGWCGIQVWSKCKATQDDEDEGACCTLTIYSESPWQQLPSALWPWGSPKEQPTWEAGRRQWGALAPLSSYFPTRCLEKIASQPHASAATWRGGHGACLQGLLRRFGRLVHREGLAQCLEYSESYVRKTYHCCNSSSDHY